MAPSESHFLMLPGAESLPPYRSIALPLCLYFSTSFFPYLCFSPPLSFSFPHCLFNYLSSSFLVPFSAFFLHPSKSFHFSFPLSLSLSIIPLPFLPSFSPSPLPSLLSSSLPPPFPYVFLSLSFLFFYFASSLITYSFLPFSSEGYLPSNLRYYKDSKISLMIKVNLKGAIKVF